MSTLPRVREQIELVQDDELRSVCLLIIDEVSKRAAKPNIGLWTIDAISKWIGKNPDDPFVIRGIQLLSSRQESQLLETHFIFFDPNSNEDAGEIIEDEEVASAYSTGSFIHPVSGEPVPNFEDYLLPYFLPAEDLLSQ